MRSDRMTDIHQSGLRTQVRLARPNATFVIAADEWRELVEIALKMGWQSEYAACRYWQCVELDVSASDAIQMSLALGRLCNYLTARQSRYPRQAVLQLIESVGQLVVYCQGGGFRLC